MRDAGARPSWRERSAWRRVRGSSVPRVLFAAGALLLACDRGRFVGEVGLREPPASTSSTNAPPEGAGTFVPEEGPFEPPDLDLRRLSRPDPATMAAQQWAYAADVDGASCRASLARTGAVFSSLKDLPSPNKDGCGIPHGVLVQKGPTGIRWEPPLEIDCSLAVDLPRIERAIQDESQRAFGVPIQRAQTFGTYACRPRNGRVGAAVSDHAFGLAVDLAALIPKGRPPVVVLRDWDRGPFLRALYTHLKGQAGLSVVLGPDDDAMHRNHIHFDAGWRWWHPARE